MNGKTISHYEIIEKLGEGGMGVVYKAQDLKLDRHVALKFLPPDLTRETEAKKRFLHEAKTASSLQHRNICTIHEIDETAEGQVFIVMDLSVGLLWVDSQLANLLRENHHEDPYECIIFYIFIFSASLFTNVPGKR